MKQIKKEHACKKRYISGIATLLLIFCIVSSAPVFSADDADKGKTSNLDRYSRPKEKVPPPKKDLLLRPSEKTDLASYSILMGVETVKGGVVAVGERGHIIYADSGCIAWTQADVPVSIALTAVCFPTELKGWAVGHDGVVLHTEDGGKTWAKQLDGRDINAIMSAKASHLIKTKTELLEREDPELDETMKEELSIEIENLALFSTDLSLVDREGPVYPLMDVWFKNDREGIVIGTYGVILLTTDGGKNWESLLDRIDNMDGSGYYSITRSGDDLFIAGEYGMLFRSEDFGRTWKRLASPYEGTFFGITGDPEGGGFVTAFGLRGNIFYSLDRGETWSRIKNEGQASLSSGTFLSDGTYGVMGVDGIVLQISDKGKILNALNTEFPGAIAITELKRGVLAIVGLNGFKRIDLKQ